VGGFPPLSPPGHAPSRPYWRPVPQPMPVRLLPTRPHWRLPSLIHCPSWGLHHALHYTTFYPFLHLARTSICLTTPPATLPHYYSATLPRLCVLRFDRVSSHPGHKIVCENARLPSHLPSYGKALPPVGCAAAFPSTTALLCAHQSPPMPLLSSRPDHRQSCRSLDLPDSTQPSTHSPARRHRPYHRSLEGMMPTSPERSCVGDKVCLWQVDDYDSEDGQSVLHVAA
jgi:hypothetical protein